MPDINGSTRNRIYKFIQDFTAERGYSPTYKEIEEYTGLGTGAVEGHIKRMERDGLIEREHYVQRSIRVKRPKNRMTKFAAMSRESQREMLSKYFIGKYYSGIDWLGDAEEEYAKKCAEELLDWLYSPAE